MVQREKEKNRERKERERAACVQRMAVVHSDRREREKRVEREGERKIRILSFLLDDQWSNIVSFGPNFMQRILVANSTILMVLIYILPSLRYFLAISTF